MPPGGHRERPYATLGRISCDGTGFDREPRHVLPGVGDFQTKGAEQPTGTWAAITLNATVSAFVGGWLSLESMTAAELQETFGISRADWRRVATDPGMPKPNTSEQNP
ncbi:hypothetical protein [Streptomyces sp. NPDC056255]|uniref:hypothetical protein n=1 Tax=Streptomyces sp. NPDC056255 TaxID=3345764 RepID=UPI0035E38FA5